MDQWFVCNRKTYSGDGEFLVAGQFDENGMFIRGLVELRDAKLATFLAYSTQHDHYYVPWTCALEMILG